MSTKTWLGGSGQFANPSLWEPSTVPTFGDTAVLDSGIISVGAGAANGVNFVMAGQSAQTAPLLQFQGSTFIGNISETNTHASQYGTVSLAANATVTATRGVTLSGAAGGSTTASLSVQEQPYSTFKVWGASSVADGATFTVSGGSGTGTFENDGVIQVGGGSALNLDTVSVKGNGTIDALAATGGSAPEIRLNAVNAGETVALNAGNLSLWHPMSFAGSVTNFGAAASITLYTTQATSAVFNKTGPTAGDLILNDGGSIAANIKISGQANIYWSDDPASGSVTLTAYNTGHSVPSTTVLAGPAA